MATPAQGPTTTPAQGPTAAPPKELKLLFTLNDAGSKGFLTLQEFRRVVDRVRKRDRIRDPVDDSVVDAIFTLLDPTHSGKVSFETFNAKFNGVFYESRHSFYKGKKAAGVVGFAASPIKYKPMKEIPEGKDGGKEEGKEGGKEEGQKEEDGRTSESSTESKAALPKLSHAVASRDQLEIHKKQSSALPPDFKLPAQPPQLPNTRQEIILPPDVRFDIPRPLLHAPEIMEALQSAPGLPGWTAGSNWTGRPPASDESFVSVECPHCRRAIDEVVIEDQLQRIASSSGRPALRPKGQTIVPVYGPYFYTGMWEVGRTVGQVPPSFFTTPYNVHTWKFP